MLEYIIFRYVPHIVILEILQNLSKPKTKENSTHLWNYPENITCLISRKIREVKCFKSHTKILSYFMLIATVKKKLLYICICGKFLYLNLYVILLIYNSFLKLLNLSAPAAFYEARIHNNILKLCYLFQIYELIAWNHSNLIHFPPLKYVQMRVDVITNLKDGEPSIYDNVFIAQL